MKTRLNPIIIGGRIYEVERHSGDGCVHSSGYKSSTLDDLEDQLRRDPPKTEPRPRAWHECIRQACEATRLLEARP